ncbi:hypothetical protein MRX96_046193 [Rhipicephalus microplus]
MQTTSILFRGWLVLAALQDERASTSLMAGGQLSLVGGTSSELRHSAFLKRARRADGTHVTKTNNRLSVMPRKFTGVAVYNVEMDDYKGACGKGKFVRLKAIKAALAA